MADLVRYRATSDKKKIAEGINVPIFLTLPAATSDEEKKLS